MEMSYTYTVLFFVSFARIAAGNTASCVATNVALNKPANVSSKYHHNSYASLAVDGNMQQNYWVGKPFCFHTLLSANNWWLVDLLKIYDIERIELYNRMDCCSTRARKFQVFIGESLESFSQVGFVESMGQNTTIDIPGKRRGRYVKLVQTVIDLFHLCEVKVFAQTDPCCSSPCQNGGVCSVDNSVTEGYKCNCAVYSDYMFAGKNCEESWIKISNSSTYVIGPKI